MAKTSYARQRARCSQYLGVSTLRPCIDVQSSEAMLPLAQAASQGQFEQAALAGVLSALYDLGLSLRSVKKMKPKEE